MQPFPIKIAGLGRALPAQIVTSQALEKKHGLDPGWIERRSGVRERRWVTETESNSGLGATAVREAVADAGLNLNDIDLFINASGSVEQAIPDGGALLQRALGLDKSGVPCFSVHATCLSFINALQVAASFLMTNQYRRIVISSAEISSRTLNFNEPESWTLLGDAAAAVVVTRTPPGEASQLEAMHFATYSEGAYLTALNGGGTRRHPDNPATRPEDNWFTMDGPQVLRRVMRYSPAFLETLQPGLSSGLNGLDWVVPHQASLIGIKMLRLFRWPEERIATTIAWLGNCVAASVPATLYEAVRQGQIVRGERVLLVGSGAGLSLGGIILTF